MATNNDNAYITIDYNKLSDEKQKEFFEYKPTDITNSEKKFNLLSDQNTLALKEAKDISITWTKPNNNNINLNPIKITIDETDHILKSPVNSNILDDYKLQITKNASSKGGGNSKRYYGTPLKKTRYAKRKSANRRKRAKTARLFREFTT